MAEKTRSNAHMPGPTRIHADGSYIISGGVDGTVSIYSSLRWPNQAPLWTQQMHEGAVTSVTINVRKNKAITAGRDGCVKMIAFTPPSENQSQKSATTSLQVQLYNLCKTTGEVRFVSTDADCQRIFIAGDSLRMLTLPDGDGGSCGVTSIGLTIPHPIISLALSPCERYLAIASACRSVAVLDLPLVIEQMKVGAAPSTQAFSETQAEVGGWGLGGATGAAAVVKQQGTHVLKELLSPSFTKEENAVLRMSFLRTMKDTMILAIPAVEGVRVFQILPSGTSGFELRPIGTIVQEMLRDVVHVQLFQSSRNKYNALVGTAEGVMSHLDGIHDTKFTSNEKASWRVREVDGTLCQCGVDATSGNLFYASTGGSITMLKKILPFLERQSQQQQKSQAEPSQAARQQTVGEEEEDDAPLPAAPAKKKGIVDREAGRTSGSAIRVDDGEESEIDYGDSSSSSGGEEEEDDGNVDVDTTSEGSEDMDEVARDLQRGGASKRRSRHREPNPYVQAEVRKMEKKRRRHFSGGRSLIDDEADGSDSEDNYYDDEEGEEGDDRRFEDDVDDDEEGDMQPQIGARSGAPLVPLEYTHHAPANLDYVVQPGATNPDTATGNHYLAFNAVGAIMRTAVDSVHVVFHDLAKGGQKLTTLDSHRAVSGALSSRGAVLALRAMDKDEVATIAAYKGLEPEAKSQEIYIRHFGYNVSDDCRLALPSEEIRCLAAGQSYVCVVTNTCLRLFTYTGLEIYAMVAPHNIVSVVGKNVARWGDACTRDPFSDPLAIVTVAGNQHSLRILDVPRRSEELSSTPLPLSVDADGTPSQLQWMGWADDGSFYVADSDSVLRKLHPNFGYSWLPMMDMRAMEGFIPGYYWPWGVQGGHLSLCVAKEDEATKIYNGPPCAVTPTLPKSQRILLEVQLLSTIRLNKEGNSKKKPMDDPQVAWVNGTLEADALKNGYGLYYTMAMDELDTQLDTALIERYLTYSKNNDWAKCIDLVSLMQSSKLLERLLKNKGASVGRNKLETQLLVNELEKRLHLRNKRICQKPTNSSFAAQKEGGVQSYMSDVQRETMMNLLWGREGAGVDAEIAQRKAAKVNKSGESALKAAGVVVDSVLPQSGLAAAAPIPISNRSLYENSSSMSMASVAPAIAPAPPTPAIPSPVVVAKPVLKTNSTGSTASITGASPGQKRVGFTAESEAKSLTAVTPASKATAPVSTSSSSPFAVAGNSPNPFAKAGSANSTCSTPARSLSAPSAGPASAPVAPGARGVVPPPPPPPKRAKVQTQIAVTARSSPPKAEKKAETLTQMHSTAPPNTTATVAQPDLVSETQSQYTQNPFADLPPAPGTDWKVTDTQPEVEAEEVKSLSPSQLLSELENAPPAAVAVAAVEPREAIVFPTAVRTQADQDRDINLVTQRGKRDRGGDTSDDEEELVAIKIK